MGGNDGVIISSYAAGTVEAYAYGVGSVGGLVSFNRSLIDRSHATGTVRGNAAGGLAGGNSGKISGSYATGDVFGSASGGTGSVGGLVGSHNSEQDEIAVIEKSYATGNVYAGDRGGGLVGHVGGATVLSSYATGAVVGNPNNEGNGPIGGFIGLLQQREDIRSLVSASFASGRLYGLGWETGGLVGSALQLEGLQATLWNSDITAVGIGKVINSEERALPGSQGVSTVELQSTDGYTGIFDGWEVDGANVWHFGNETELPALKVDYDGDGVATWQEFGEQPRRTGAALLQPFDPVLSQLGEPVPRLQVPNGKYDTDGDGLIEISNLEQLDAVRHDLEGNGVPNHPDLERQNRQRLKLSTASPEAYAAAFPTDDGESVCLRSCRGFELTRSLDFMDPASYASRQVNPAWTQGRGWTTLWANVDGYQPGRDWRNWGLEEMFEGNGNTISNLHMDLPEEDRRKVPIAGLFGIVNRGAIVQNLGLVDARVTSRAAEYVGLLTAQNGGLISNCYVTGTLSGGGNWFGGLAATNTWPGEVRNSHSDVTLGPVDYDLDYRSWGKLPVGGLVGFNHGLISDSHSKGNVVGEPAGGLVADNYGTILRSHATGDVQSRAYGVGGLVGRNDGAIISSYATGAVAGKDRVGGLTGVNWFAFASYATGDVTAERGAGGLVGVNRFMVASYATGSVTNQSGDALVGGNPSFIAASYATGPVNGEEGAAFVASGGKGYITGNYSMRALEAQGVEHLPAEELTGPTGYDGIYSDWNLDLDNFDWDHNPITGTDDYWDFGDSSQHPTLKVDFDSDGIATCQEFGEQPGCVGRPLTSAQAAFVAGQSPPTAGQPAPVTASESASQTAEAGNRPRESAAQRPTGGVDPAAPAGPAGTGGPAVTSEAAPPTGSSDSTSAENQAPAQRNQESFGTQDSQGGGCSAPGPSGSAALPVASVLVLLTPLGLVAMRKQRSPVGPARPVEDRDGQD